MPTSQFTCTAMQNYRAGSGYTRWRTGYPSGTNTTALSYSYHPYKSYFFFDSAAINAALLGKVVDNISLTLTPGYFSGRQSASIHTFRMANCTAMPDAATGNNMASGIGTTTGTNSYFVEALATWTLDANAAGSGVIATDAAANRLADSLKAGNALGMLYRHTNEGGTVYSPNSGLNYNGGDVAPVLTITYHDAGSIWTNAGGVWKLGMPYVNVGGVWHAGTAYQNVGGTWKQGIG